MSLHRQGTAAGAEPSKPKKAKEKKKEVIALQQHAKEVKEDVKVEVKEEIKKEEIKTEQEQQEPSRKKHKPDIEETKPKKAKKYAADNADAEAINGKSDEAAPDQGLKEKKTSKKSELLSQRPPLQRELVFEDAPPDHESHRSLKYIGPAKAYWFSTRGVRLQLTTPKVEEDHEECKRLLRLCYLEVERGANKEEATRFRNDLVQLWLRHAAKGAAAGAQPPKPTKAKEKKEASAAKPFSKKLTKIKAEVKEEVKPEAVKIEAAGAPSSTGDEDSSSEGSDSESDSSASSEATEKARPATPVLAAAKMAVRTGLRCFCHYERVCPAGVAKKQP